MEPITDQLDRQIIEFMTNRDLAIVASEVFEAQNSEEPTYVVLVLDGPHKFSLPPYPQSLPVREADGMIIQVPIRYEIAVLAPTTGSSTY